jgi:putative FmdB family regulatory protein
MPVYEYRCKQCAKVSAILFRSMSDTKVPVCQHCGGMDLARLISRVSVQKSWGESLNFPGSEALDAVDENNPREMLPWIQRMKRELGDPNPQLNEFDLQDAGVDTSQTIVEPDET